MNDPAVWRKTNLGYHLFAANARFLHEKMARMAAAGYPQLTEAILTLFVSVDEQGARITDIAQNTGLTKQSVVDIVNRAEKSGWVERAMDPMDKRLRIVGFTDEGQVIRETLRVAVLNAEQSFEAVVGAPFLGEFKTRFGAYSALPVGDLGMVGGASGERADQAWRSGNAGRVLALASRRFTREALNRLHRTGHRDVGEALISLLRHLDLEGTRLTELAARARMTKQSMRELVDRAQGLELVERAADNGDLRAKIIAFTPRGLAVLSGMAIAIAATEEEARSLIGADFVAATKNHLIAYAKTTGP